jgi:trimethylamine--corrinoid protein Co-methyltransferase
MEASQVRALCKTAPKQFTQIARNRARDVVIGGQNQVFAPIYGAPFVRDLQKGRRYGDLDSPRKIDQADLYAPEFASWWLGDL